MKTLLDWQHIHTVLLDMDGTLLDLHFDNYFWLELVPQRYAAHKGLHLTEAREVFVAMCKSVEGTLNWYCVDYWTETLGLEVALLKHEVAHLIAEHPHVIDFLMALRASGRLATLVTNAHQKSLALKLQKTRLGAHLDTIISAHELGLPKEEPAFWAQLQSRVAFDPAHTLLIDDSLPVLRSAQQYGIAHLLSVARPDSQKPPREITEFPALSDFREIFPPARA